MDEVPVAKSKKSVAKPEEPVAKRKKLVAKPKMPVAKPKEPVAKPKEPVAKPKEPVAKPKMPVVKLEESIAKPKMPVAKPKEPVAKPKEPVAKPKMPVVKLEESIAKPEEPVTKPKMPVAKPKMPVAKPKEPVAKPKMPVVKLEESIAKPEEPVTKPKMPVTKLEELVAKPEEPVAKPEDPFEKPEEPVAKPKEPVAKRKKPVAKLKMPVTKPKELVAKPEEPVAKRKIPVAKPEESVAKRKKPDAKPEELVAKPEEPVAKRKKPVAKLKMPVTKPKELVAKPEEPVAKRKMPVAKPKELVTKPEESVAKPEEPVAKRKKPDAKPEEPVAKRKRPVAKPKELVAKPKEPVAKPEEPGAKRKRPVAKPEEPVAKTEEPVAKRKRPVAKPEEPVAKPEEPVAKRKRPVAKPKKPLAKPKKPVAKPKMPVAKPKEPVAKPKMPVAKPKMPVAKTEESVAKPEEPVAKRKRPVAKPEEPVAKTEEPVAKRKRPVAKPEEPVAKTEEPVAKPLPDKFEKTKTFDKKNLMFLVPFEYGWVREFKYRKKISKHTSDVYYRTPVTGKRIRSKREIENHLALTNDDRLTSMNFTFYREPLDLNDKSKEIIIGETCDELKNEKNNRRNLDENTLESNLTTNNTTMADNDERVMSSDENITMSDSEQENEIPTINNISNQTAAVSGSLWLMSSLKDVIVNDWKQVINTLIRQNRLLLNTSLTVIPKGITARKIYWQNFTEAIVEARQLNVIKLKECPPYVVNTIFLSFPHLKTFNTTLTQDLKNDEETNDETHEGNNNKFEFSPLSLALLDKMTNIMELRLEGLNSFVVTECPPSLEHLTRLRIFTLTSVKKFCTRICETLITLTTKLEHFGIGDCDAVGEDLTKVIRRLVNLKQLRLENLIGEIYPSNVFDAIKSIKALSILELVNVEFPNEEGTMLKLCAHIKNLLIIPVYYQRSAGIGNREILDCLKTLAEDNTLFRVFWGMPCSVSSNKCKIVNGLYIKNHERNDIPLPRRNRTTFNKKSTMVSIQHIHSTLSSLFCGSGVALKVNSEQASRIHLKDIFIDI